MKLPVREWLLLAGFVLVCVAGVFTVLLPETQNEDEPASKAPPKASEPPTEAPTGAPRR